MTARRYTEAQFRAAVDDPEVRTLADLCRALGLVPCGANYETLRWFGRSLGLDVDHELASRRLDHTDEPHTGVRSYSDAQLLAALEDPDVDGYPALCRRLGLKPYHGTYARLRRRARALGTEIPAAWSRPGPRPGAGRRDHEPVPFPEDAVRAAVARSLSLTATLRALGSGRHSAVYARLRHSIDHYGIDTSHFRANGGGGRRLRPLEHILQAGRPANSTEVRRRLVAEDVKEHRCEACGRTAWRGRPIPLELDHVNGDRWDNRVDNLRLLCPNCHALTPTYRGRNIRRRVGTDGGDGDAPSGRHADGGEYPPQPGSVVERQTRGT